MRIVHLACVAPPETGGIGRVAALEAELLRGRGMDAVVIAPDRSGVTVQPGIERLRSELKVGNAGMLDPDLLRKRVADVDVVHLHYPFFGSDLPVAMMRRHGAIKRLVITVHMDAISDGMKGFIFDTYRQLFQTYILRSADIVFVSSLDYARQASFSGLLKSGRPTFAELPFGVDTERFHPAASASADKTVLFVGGMDTPHAFKGIDVLLRAMAKLPSDARCELVGDGDLRPGYEALAATLGLGERARFLGRLSETDLSEAYRRASVLAFPSTSSAEAFGLVALEAMASGIPVVASDLPGVRTVVQDGQTGLLVTPSDETALADALRRVLDDAALRQRFGAQARERAVKTYSWSAHVDALVAAYQRLCASRS